PNMPTVDTAIVYPGQVLLEATNLSEGRGTTRPFELFGAPFMNAQEVIAILNTRNLRGCLFREHNFIPTFQKWAGELCGGIQIHVTDPKTYRPVRTTAAILRAVIKLYGDKFQFKGPPYEYEAEKMPFDILSGDTGMRGALALRESSEEMRALWEKDYEGWFDVFKSVAYYKE
ncbi:MAG: DUF1343 domain-containing protein, partial [Chitinispirillales bacterium]|nr:DUF1343 domain-containing protein [Chitinispirillales bacterium]